MFGNIWSQKKQDKNNYIYKKKINKNVQLLDNQNKFMNIKSNNIFNNIFSAKTGNNVVHSKINDTNRSINGFSKNNEINGTKYWGTPTWYLFHSIAAKINEDFYKVNHTFVLDFIKSCCDVLPCPYCRRDAVNYMSKINYSMVDSKEKLKKVLFDFHNHVNKKNKKNLFNFSDLERYNKSNIEKVIELFNSRFFRSYYNTREFQDWNKTKFYKKFLNFIKHVEFD